MTNQRLSVLLVFALLFMQAFASLHRGSSSLAQSATAFHERVFAPLEHASHQHNDGNNLSQGMAGSHGSTACDTLDKQFNPTGHQASAFCLIGDPVFSHSPPIDPPARLSRFQRIGPPSHAPPALS